MVILVWPHCFAHRWWSMFLKRDDNLLSLLESVAPTEDNTVSSTQREGSGSTEDLNLQQWSSLESLVDGSRFSGEMSDVVSLEQQRKEELAAMAPPSENSVTSEGSRRTEQWVDDPKGGPTPMYSKYPLKREACAPHVLAPRASTVRAPGSCYRISPLREE